MPTIDALFLSYYNRDQVMATDGKQDSYDVIEVDKITVEYRLARMWLPSGPKPGLVHVYAPSTWTQAETLEHFHAAKDLHAQLTRLS